MQDGLNDVVEKVVGIAGKSKSAQFKAVVIYPCDSPNESQLTVAERFGVSQS